MVAEPNRGITAPSLISPRKVQSSFDLSVKGITISVDLLLGSNPSGRPTVTTSQCNSRIRDVDLDISGKLGWLLELFQNQIESKFRRILESRVR
ncbi:lipopolysaccharide-binding protein [Nannospalax galili]|uniref:lipopolysaccharide-binding protein n=1 Tax=Nannospalax galili TaxID=1026970 RepID=UPI00111C66E4|nr:lipopolysaccharide-binding protein [Nannospalax galili]